MRNGTFDITIAFTPEADPLTGDRSLDAVPPSAPSCPDARQRAEFALEMIGNLGPDAARADVLEEAINDAWAAGLNAARSAT
jgi:hypothetical protein